ncbi:MAG: lysine exporter LysO family protein [Bacillota bacterium]|nr:lysine exporter LysO family protein [Bacillota bacterium]
MWMAIVCLVVGIVFQKYLAVYIDSLILAGLYIILLGMGIRIGSDVHILNAIPIAGLKAAIYCLSATSFSVIAVVLWERLLFKQHLKSSSIRCEKSMKGELLFLVKVFGSIIMGIIAGKYCGFIPSGLSPFMINFALVLICIGIGASLKNALNMMLESGRGMLCYIVVPILITIGSLTGGLLAGVLLGDNLVDSAAISGTMVFYSFGAAIVSQQGGYDAGVLTLLSNLMRELLTFVVGPILARFSNLAPIAVGGASTLDVTLPVIKQNLDEKFTVLAIYNGIVLSLMVPLLLFSLFGVN